MNFLTKILNKITGKKDYEETTTSLSTYKNMNFSGTSWEPINRFVIDEVNVWLNGDSTKMLEFYTQANISTYPSNFLKERNCMNYFWSKSISVNKMKRTTANLVRNISTTLTNIINVPDMYAQNGEDELVQDILDDNDFKLRTYNNQMLYTLVEGWGAYRIDIDTNKYEYPKIRYFRAKNCFFVKDNEDIVAIIYLQHYVKDGNNNDRYLLVETRYVKTKDGVKYSCIDKECYKENYGGMEEVKLSECDFLTDKKAHYEFANIPFILGEPCVFYEIEGMENEGLYGRGAFYGKIDALDDYDQALSVASTCVRRSMPKTTYPVESLEQTQNGNSILPNDFDTEYIAVPSQLTGDGLDMSSATPQVVQPNLNLKNYDLAMEYSLEVILGGLMSLNDIGQNEQTFFRDSAEAIRERSRQTLYTVTHIRRRECALLKSLLNKSVFAYKYFYDGKVLSKQDIKDLDINIKYDKFLSPSKEQKIKAYLPMFQSGAISLQQFVRAIYEDEMSDTEMEEEIERLYNIRYHNDLIQQGKVDGAKEQSDGSLAFNKEAKFEKTSSPYQDELEDISDNSGMNNYNRAKKNVEKI